MCRNAALIALVWMALTGCPSSAPPSGRVRREVPVVPDAERRLSVRALADAERAAMVQGKIAEAESALRRRALAETIRLLHEVLGLAPDNQAAQEMFRAAAKEYGFLSRVRAFYLREDFESGLRLLYREGGALDSALLDRCLFAGWFDQAIVHARAARFAEATACLEEAGALRPGDATIASFRRVVTTCEALSPDRCVPAEATDFRWP